jgi:ribosomal protein L35
MPKHKPRQSVVKRFKLTKTGKLLFRGQHGRHLKKSKSKSQQRRAKVLKEMSGAIKNKIKKML